MDDELLALIVCPENKQPLSIANEETVSKLNQLVEQSTVYFVGGERIAEPLEQLLIRSDGQIGYGVYKGIPNLLIEEGILLTKLDM